MKSWTEIRKAATAFSRRRTIVSCSRSRLVSVSSNGTTLATYAYDSRSRRVKKVTQEATTTFFYDDWNLIEERVAYTNGTSSTIRCYWGKDISGTLQGAGNAPVAEGDQVGRMSEANEPRSGRKSPRVGGLLYLTVSNTNSQPQLYIPCCDSSGNVTRYLDESGSTVAQYTYGGFGNLIAKSGPLADFFRHRFSTKYYAA